jgi:hypothetical protein
MLRFPFVTCSTLSHWPECRTSKAEQTESLLRTVIARSDEKRGKRGETSRSGDKPGKTRIDPMGDATPSLQPFVLRHINISRRMCSPCSTSMFLTEHTRGISHAMSLCAVLTISKTDSAHEKNAECAPRRLVLRKSTCVSGLPKTITRYSSRIAGPPSLFYRKLADLQLCQGSGRCETSAVFTNLSRLPSAIRQFEDTRCC